MSGCGAVRVERLALELADADISQLFVDEMWDVAARERDVRRLHRARKRGDRDEVEWQCRELAGQPLRLFDPLLREPAVEGRVAVHDLVHVEERLPVPCEDEEAHRRSLSCGRPP